MILAEIQNINILRQVHLEVSYLVSLMRPLGAQYGPQLTSNKRGKINEVYILSGPTFVGKWCHMLCYLTKGYVIFSTKNRSKNIMMPNWFLDHLQLFLAKVFIYWIHFSLGLKWKNPGSWVPSLMAADKPCPKLQPSLVLSTFAKFNIFGWPQFHHRLGFIQTHFM